MKMNLEKDLENELKTAKEMLEAEKAKRKELIIEKVCQKKTGLEFRNYKELLDREINLLNDKIKLLDENIKLLKEIEEEWGKERTELKATINRLEKELEKEKLTAPFLDLQKALWEIQNYEGCGKLFDRLANPIQTLLGLAEAIDSMTDEIRDYYMWDIIVEQSVRELAYSKEFLLPSSRQGEFDRTKGEKEANEKSSEQLKEAITNNESRKEQGGITRRKFEIIQEFSSIIKRLDQLQKIREKYGFDWEQPVNRVLLGMFAEMTKAILERHQIYPMFASDDRLEQYPELRERFGSCGENSIRYPGLFIQYDEKWDVLGSYIGMD